MTKDYTPKNTDFVWNGDESKHTEARKMLARKVREKFGGPKGVVAMASKSKLARMRKAPRA